MLYAPHTFRAFFADMLGTLGLQGRGFKPYSLRRGGATHHFREFANVSATTLRGRWESIKTARIYITDGIAAQQEIRFSSAELRIFRRFDAVLIAAVSGQEGMGGRSLEHGSPRRVASQTSRISATLAGQRSG